MAWLKAHYAAGRFVVSGRRVRARAASSSPRRRPGRDRGAARRPTRSCAAAWRRARSSSSAPPRPRRASTPSPERRRGGGGRTVPAVDADQVLAFRLARSGLAARDGRGLAAAAACPASDFARDAALLALAARDRRRHPRALPRGDRRRRRRRRAHRPRRDPRARARRPRALRPRADRPRRRRARPPSSAARSSGSRRRRASPRRAALDEVAAATSRRAEEGPGARQERAARGAPRARQRGPHALVPGLQEPPRRADAVALRDGQGGRPARRRAPLRPGPRRAARRPRARPSGASCASTGRPAGRLRRLGRARQAPRPAAVGRGRGPRRGGRRAQAGCCATTSPTSSRRPPRPGLRLLPPGDPYLQKPNRALLAPDEELRKRLFRPVASPGAVLRDGRLAGLWRARAKGRRTELSVEKLGRLARGDLEDEAGRVAALRGSSEAVVAIA